MTDLPSEDLLERALSGQTPLMHVLERLLAHAERLSLGHWVRELVWRRRPDEACRADFRIETVWRYRAGRALDVYILVWIVIELVVLAVAHRLPAVAVLLATYRLVEIVQVFANAVLFDEYRQLRAGYVKEYMVLSAQRTIVHSVLLLGEAILCFAILYSAARGSFTGTGIHDSIDALDASLRTITTVGTSAVATGWFRLVVDIEPVFGLLFAGTVLTRAFSAMPSVQDTKRALDRHSRDADAW
ncbi:hypothetical protein [Conexibacter woesei]|uniref:hypothetical protein n=1 Tax=Conexibacter woesei TaxID=191495 RepID=UPI0004229432|nr:hypothetical protein [Conexibacter woesei]